MSIINFTIHHANFTRKGWICYSDSASQLSQQEETHVKSKFAALAVAGLIGLSLVTPAQASAQPSVSSANTVSLATSAGMSKQVPAHIVALGDSYGSGTGAGSYKPGTETTCLQSVHSPSEQVVAALVGAGYPVDFANKTCAGATIPDVRATQLSALKKSTLLVFLTIGGNDIGFGKVVEDCSDPAKSSCVDGAIPEARGKLIKMGIELGKLLGKIKSLSPKAKVILFGYGQPMSANRNPSTVPAEFLDPICGAAFFDENERREGAKLSAELDGTLRGVALVADQVPGFTVAYVSPYDRSKVGGLDSRFAGRSLCEVPVPEQRYRGFDVFALPPDGDPAGKFAVLHMNRSGYTVLAEMVLTEVPSGAALN
jgi:lysophospholipase L1-like esterase